MVLALIGRATRVTVVAAVLAVLASCGTYTSGAERQADDTTATETESPPAAREGRTAESERITFVPAEVILPGGQSAPVESARTVDGELIVPEDVANVGWWDGSSSVNDAFGTTVIAGHVDSATEGLGYFARLLQIEPGEEVTAGGEGHEQAYRVVSVESVTKEALATSSDAFDQTGEHRLVLITCTGTFAPGEGYDSNLVVVAEPVGSPT